MIQPMGDNLLLEPIPVEEMTSGGLYIPDNARQAPDKGKIIDIGSDIKDSKLVKDTVVLFRKNVGEEIRYSGNTYIILPVREVIGILKGDK